MNSNLTKAAFQPVDNASATVFRICFGLIMAHWAWDYLTTGIVTRMYVEPKFHFTYYLFDWVQPWPGSGMYLHFVALIVLALCIATGCFYRLSSWLFAVGFTYVFLLERTNYQNHYYLIGLIAWWLPVLPLQANVSVDAHIWPHLKSQTMPAWVLWVLQFHIALPYFFGGVAKINADWLQGEPLGQMLASQVDLPILGPALAGSTAAVFLAWTAMVFDLSVVPLLMWKRTRVFAYCSCIAFHLMNSVVFSIHVFPWLMLLATPIFFHPDWPRRVLGASSLNLELLPETRLALNWQRSLLLAGLGLYAVFHCVWPLRHYVYPGDASWNERGHYFAWRMMLRGKPVVLGFAVRDVQTGQVVDGAMKRFVNSEQADRFGRDPEMILQFGQFIGRTYQDTTGHPCEIYALVLASLNGRKPELFLDPNVDLMRESRGFYERTWVLPQREPLRRPAWDVPVEKWREHVELPQLKFMATSSPIGRDDHLLTTARAKL